MMNTPQSTCQHCGAPIIWGKSTGGRPQPLNPDGVVHFATCPTLKAPKPFPTNCHNCNSENLIVGPGTDVHAGRLKCGECGAFIKWLSKQQLEQISGSEQVNHD
jgi:hypothetical protein